MKTHLFAISLVALAALTHTNYQIAAATPYTRNPIQSRIIWDTRPVTSIAFSPDGSKLITSPLEGTAYIWDTKSGKLLPIFLNSHTNPITSVAFSPDGSMIAGSDGHKARIWNTSSGSLVRTLRGHTGRINSVTFSPDGSMIATGSDDCTAHVWNTSSGSLVRTLRGHTGRINSVAFSPDGSKLATGAFDGTARIWDAHSGALLHILNGLTIYINSVAFSPDGSMIAHSDDHTVRILDTRSGTLVHTLSCNTPNIYSIAFSPDGSKLAIGSWEHTAHIWDTHSGTLVHTLIGHTARVTSVAFSPDGSKLATGSDDNTARIWYDTRTENKMCGAALALLTACHPRLGEASPAHVGLDPYTIREIINLARPDSFGPIEQEHHAQAEGPTPALHQPVQREHQGLTRYLPTFAIAAPSIAAAAWLLRHFMHR